MEITVSKDKLGWALGIAQNMVAKKTTMPILVNLLLTAEGNECRISASDLELTAVVKVPATVKSPGSTTINAKVFSDIVRELPEGEIHLKLTEGERLEITNQKTKLKMIGVSAEEYPALPGIGLQTKAKIDGKQLADMIGKTIYAVATDETRFNLSGVCFEAVEGADKGKKALRMIATDGHRLAVVTRPVEGLSFTNSIIVPRKGLVELKKLLDGNSDREVGVAVEEGFLVVEIDNAKMAMRLIDAEFPDCSQVIPKKKGKCAQIDTHSLSQALKRVALMVTDKGKGVRLDFSEGTLRVSSQSPELGEGREELPIEYTGEPVSIGFNANYIIDVGASLEGSKGVCIEHQGELGPAKIYSTSDESYFGIVMPMRL